jgi:hypothetical protein
MFSITSIALTLSTRKRRRERGDVPLPLLLLPPHLPLLVDPSVDVGLLRGRGSGGSDGWKSKGRGLSME